MKSLLVSLFAALLPLAALCRRCSQDSEDRASHEDRHHRHGRDRWRARAPLGRGRPPTTHLLAPPRTTAVAGERDRPERESGHAARSGGIRRRGACSPCRMAPPRRSAATTPPSSRAKWCSTPAIPIPRVTARWPCAIAQRGTGVASAEYLPGTRLVRAFNAINSGPLAREAFRKPERIGIPLAADDRGSDEDRRATRPRRGL